MATINNTLKYAVPPPVQLAIFQQTVRDYDKTQMDNYQVKKKNEWKLSFEQTP